MTSALDDAAERVSCSGCGVPLERDAVACPACGLSRAEAHAASEAPTQRGFEQKGSGDDGRFRPGKVILGHYTLVRQLGRGGMGTVFLARDDVSGQEVAVKALPASLARERDIRERFVQEARALASMDHPNIVPLMTFAQEGEDRFLVMKYIPGEALDARIRRQRVLPPDDARKVLRALLSALGYAHARGVIHRDVKPSNVIIEGDLDGAHRIFLVDFGIAKKDDAARERLTQTGMLMGTPQYMSPEQISGHAIDGRSDLYAAGLVLFEMLTGQPPFDGDKTFQVLRAHVEAPVPDVRHLRGSDVPEDLLSLCYLLLRKDPGHRPANAERAIALLDGAEPTALEAKGGRAYMKAPRTRATPATLSGVRAIRLSDADILAAEPSADALSDPSAEELAALRSRRRGGLVAGVLLGGLAIGGWWVAAQVPPDLFAPLPTPEVPAEPTRDPDLTVSLLLAKARLALESKDRAQIEDARITIGAALERDPDNPKALLLHAEMLLALELPDEADREIEKLAALGTLELEQRRKLEELNVLATEVRLRVEAAEAERLEAERARRERERREREKGTPPSQSSDRALSAVTSKTKKELVACYVNHVLSRNPKARGKVVLRLTVEPTGVVKRVDVVRGFGSGSFKTCVANAARTWAFPPWKGSTDTFVHELVFSR